MKSEVSSIEETGKNIVPQMLLNLILKSSNEVSKIL